MSRLLKRVADRVAAAVLLLLLSPLLAAIAVWILLDGGGRSARAGAGRARTANASRC